MALSPNVPTNSGKSTRHCPFQNSGALATSTIALVQRTTIRRSRASSAKAFRECRETGTRYNSPVKPVELADGPDKTPPTGNRLDIETAIKASPLHDPRRGRGILFLQLNGQL